MFAECNDGKALIHRAGYTFFYCGSDSLIERMIGEVGEDARDAGQVPHVRKIGNGSNERNALPLLAQRGSNIIRRAGERTAQSAVEIASFNGLHQASITLDQPGQERTVCVCTCNGFTDRSFIHAFK